MQYDEIQIPPVHISADGHVSVDGHGSATAGPLNFMRLQFHEPDRWRVSIISQELLGVCYKDGFNDYGEAMKWFKKAADQENTWAQFWLGYCNEYRLNNITEAVRWYHKAASQGNEKAKAALKRLGY